MSTLRAALAHIKIAATRQVKEIQKLVDAGKFDEARAMAAKLEAAGVLKKSRPGTPLKRLGVGREGVADLVLGAADAPTGHELAVRKAYDPKASMFNENLPNRKVQIGQLLKSDKNVAQMFTPGEAHRAGNVPYHIGEFVPGKALRDVRNVDAHVPSILDADTRVNAAAQHLMGTDALAQDIVHNRGFFGRGVNLHGDNTRITPSGTAKIIDYMPFRGSEMPQLGDAPLQGVNRRFPHFTLQHAQQEGEMVKHRQDAARALLAGDAAGHAGFAAKAEALERQLNAQPKNIVEGFKQLGGSRQARKVRGPTSVVAPLSAAAPAASAAIPNLAPTMAPSLAPTMAPSLRARFSNLPTAGKAGVIGGAALGAGLLGYGAYRMLRPRQPAQDPNTPT